MEDDFSQSSSMWETYLNTFSQVGFGMRQRSFPFLWFPIQYTSLGGLNSNG